MNVYEFGALDAQYASYAASQTDALKRLFLMDGLSKFVDWPDDIFIQFNDDSFNKGKPLPDIAHLSIGSVVLNGRAFKALHSCLSDFGEFLQLHYQSEVCYLYNVTNIVDCAQETGTGRLPQLKPPKFEQERLPSHGTVFKIPSRKSTHLYVAGESLQKLIDENNLSGATFTLM